jgi:hypothetical protein
MKFALYLTLVLLTLSVSACRQDDASATPTSAEPDAVKTSAAITAQALQTQRANPPTSTPMPTETPAGGTATPGGPTETPGGPTPAGGASPLPGTPGSGTSQPPTTGGTDSAEFIADVTVPDGTQFAAGDTFDKTWSLRNNGTSTWTTDYKLVFISGNQMNGPALQPLVANVAPGETVELTVAMTAPAEPGTHRGFWMMQNSLGENFGIGPASDLAFYVEISVLGEGGQPVPTSPPAGGSGVVESVGITVDQSSFTGACPHTFSFAVSVTVSEPALVTIELIAGSDNPGYLFNLPAPQTYNLGTGTSSFVYTLDLTASVNAYAIARVTSPVVVDSNTANFSLTCQ